MEAQPTNGCAPKDMLRASVSRVTALRVVARFGVPVVLPWGAGWDSDPATDATRIWQETVDHSRRVRIVRPDVKVTGGKKVHYLFDAQGNFIGTF